MQTQELPTAPHVGDQIRLRRDALVEVAPARPGAPPTWRYLAAGSRGKLIGFRDRADSESRAVIDVANVDRRLVVFVSETTVVPASESPASAGGRSDAKRRGDD